MNLVVNDVQRVRLEDSPTYTPPATSPPTYHDPIEKLERLKKLLDDGVIDSEQFQRMRDLIAGG
ncbi:SHOCT domain-containing protein [Mesorhizobium sanjuanii]|uniref:SHOCT domain-containing protein n=1 Tax=Mesorhizobium sanjuanii TaxID=2037900 RepID=UPI001FE0BE52|nr:SHOCT domain-containing protein [Mesorhizobium sanjuanii]